MTKKLTLTEHQKKYINPNAKKWIEMLLPNDIDQAQSTLQKHNSFCCLGVGALVCQINTGIELPIKNGEFNGGNLSNEFKFVRQWLGLQNGHGTFASQQRINEYPLRGRVDAFTNQHVPSHLVGDSIPIALIGLNDRARWNFTQIALFMLEFPEEVFFSIEQQKALN